jgi:hypothetical protein
VVDGRKYLRGAWSKMNRQSGRGTARGLNWS